MLVVGLGNPGERYANTLHNVGFRVLEQLAGRFSVGAVSGADWRARFQGECLTAERGGDKLVLLKPQTFMNRSGESVRLAAAFFKIPAVNTLVVHDELDLDPGRLQLKRGGGEGGHNGLKSVSAELGTSDYLRLRVGVGRPPAGTPVPDFLLRPLSDAEQLALMPCIVEATEAAELLVDHGSERAMNLVNRRPKAVKPTPSGDPPATPGGRPN
jgi:peptidyl-tRNA hydrolase, PTH1 family